MKPTGFLKHLMVTIPVLGAVSGCAVGPDFHNPPPPAANAYTPGGTPTATHAAAGTAQSFASGADILGDWWTLYQSPELNALIAAGLKNNPTLTAAQQTLIEAEENLRAGQGSFAPSVSAGFQAERTKISSAELANSGVGGTNVNIPAYNLYNASLSLSYMLDLFGGIRRQVEGLAAQADYQRFELEAAYLTLTSNIVTAAVTEASLHAQIDATNQVIGAEQSDVDILGRQVALGGVAVADLLTEQATLANAKATLPPLQAQLAQTRNQLAAYVGVLPVNFNEADFTLDSLHLPQNLPVSVPSALTAQRPDIAAAAAQLHAASAEVGVATANMLPQITLSADVGHEALDTASLFTPQTLIWSLVGGVAQPIFEGGTLTAKRKAAVAAFRASGAQYQSTVIAAFQSVADALQVLQYDADTLAAADAAADAAQKSLNVAESQHKLGGQPLSIVLIAQTTYQNALLARAKAEAARLADTAALFQALGGGWWNRHDVSPDAQACCGLIP